MTNEDAIDFIEEHISPGDLVEMLDDSTEIPIIPGCGYTKSIRFGKRFWDAKEDEDGQGI